MTPKQAQKHAHKLKQAIRVLFHDESEEAAKEAVHAFMALYQAGYQADKNGRWMHLHNERD